MAKVLVNNEQNDDFQLLYFNRTDSVTVENFRTCSELSKTGNLSTPTYVLAFVLNSRSERLRFSLLI